MSPKNARFSYKVLCLILLGVMATGCEEKADRGPVPVPDIPLPTVNEKLSRFGDCRAIETALRARKELWDREMDRYIAWVRAGYEGNDVAIPVDAVSPGASIDRYEPSLTNNQEGNVDEGDKVKAGTHHLFVVQESKIQVIDRGSRELIGSLDVSGLLSPELYWAKDRLVVIGRSRMGDGSVAKFYSADAEGMPNLVSEKKFTGQLLETRLIDSRLFLVFRHFLSVGDIKGDRIHGVPCGDVFGPAIFDFDSRFVTVFSLDVTDPESERSAGFIGGGDHLYASGRALYVVKEGMTWFGWDPRESYQKMWQRTVVTRVALDADSGMIDVNGFGLVTGRLRNRLSMKELDGGKSLSIATTYQDSEWKNVNKMWILDLANGSGSLKVRSTSEEFGLGEDIRSVRYIGSKAYVVTFKRTDPLFVFDLSNPEKPVLLSELMVPGFSSYLHVVQEGELLGVGYQASDSDWFSLTQGVQISLFDVSNPSRVSVIRQEGWGQRGSYVPVTDDSHAFFYDRNRNRVAVPVVLSAGQTADSSFESGALVVDLNQGLQSDLLSHFDMIPEQCLPAHMSRRGWKSAVIGTFDIDRVFELDGSLVTVSRFGVRFRKADEPRTVVKEIRFAGDVPDDCFRLGQFPGGPFD